MYPNYFSNVPTISVAYKLFLVFAGGTGKHTEMHSVAYIESAEYLLLQRQLRWLDHVFPVVYYNMSNKLLHGQRPVG